MNKLSLFHKWILPSLITIFLSVVLAFTFIEVYNLASSTRNWTANFTLTWGLFLSVLLFIGLFVFITVIINLWSSNWAKWINDTLVIIRERFKWFNWILVLILPLLPTKIFLYSPLGLKLSGIFLRFIVFLTTSVLIAFFASHKNKELINQKMLLVSLLILGSVFAIGKSLTSVVDHPLSLSWSEGNRIWDYSIVFGRELYNYPKDLPIEAYIDRARQTLWGLPFLLPDVSILLVRLWSAILFTLPYAIFGWMVFRFQPNGKKQWFWMGLWVFLFLNQGPIYTPLILSAILVAGSRQKPMWIALSLIFIAGYYAQSSRINWMFAVGIWAMIIGLCDFSPKEGGRYQTKDWINIAAYSLTGFLGGFGLFLGFLRIYNHFKGAINSRTEIVSTPIAESVTTYVNPNDSIEVISEMNQNTIFSNQPLLWERLLPNPTYGLGILLGLILAVGPLLLLLFILSKSKAWKLNLWQKIGFLGGLSSLMGLGILISTKIGGGGDLHNLDMFLVGMVFAAALAWRAGGYKVIRDVALQPVTIRLLTILIVALPAFLPWVSAKPLELPPEDKTIWTLELLRAETERIRSQGGEILFMDQRQLLTFGNLGNIPLIPEYEKKLVMDRAMSGDREYFDQFYQDIRRQRFGLIISDPQRVRLSGEDEGWGLENDTWVQWITKPLLCFYEPAYTVKKTGVWLLTPIDQPGECDYP